MTTPMQPEETTSAPGLEFSWTLKAHKPEDEPMATALQTAVNWALQNDPATQAAMEQAMGAALAALDVSGMLPVTPDSPTGNPVSLVKAIKGDPDLATELARVTEEREDFRIKYEAADAAAKTWEFLHQRDLTAAQERIQALEGDQVKAIKAPNLPSFAEVGEATKRGDGFARLYWMALAQVMTVGVFRTKTPEEVHAHLVDVARDVYQMEPELIMTTRTIGLDEARAIYPDSVEGIAGADIPHEWSTSEQVRRLYHREVL